MEKTTTLRGNSYELLLEENKRLEQTVSDQMNQISELQNERAKLTAERDEFTNRKIFYQDSFKQYEQMAKEMEEERAELKNKIINLEERLSAVTKAEQAKVTKSDSEECMRANVIEDTCFDNEDQQQGVAETPTTNVNKSSPSRDSGICVKDVQALQAFSNNLFNFEICCSRC